MRSVTGYDGFPAQKCFFVSPIGELTKVSHECCFTLVSKKRFLPSDRLGVAETMIGMNTLKNHEVFIMVSGNHMQASPLYGQG